jgi:hypothetical protein
MQAMTIGPDLAKAVFQVHDVDASGGHLGAAPLYMLVDLALRPHRVGRFLYSLPRGELVLSTKVGQVLRAPRRAGIRASPR